MQISESLTMYTDESADAAITYMGKIRTAIDREFGKGYAVKHPSLVGAMIQASAMSSVAWAQLNIVNALNGEIREQLRDIGIAIAGIGDSTFTAGEAIANAIIEIPTDLIVQELSDIRNAIEANNEDSDT